MKQVQQMMKDMFKQPNQHHHLDDDSDIDEAACTSGDKGN
jgi:hypothetical protein